MTFFVNMTS